MTPSDYLAPRFILYWAALLCYILALAELIWGWVIVEQRINWSATILYTVLGTIWLTLLVLHLRIQRKHDRM